MYLKVPLHKRHSIGLDLGYNLRPPNLTVVRRNDLPEEGSVIQLLLWYITAAHSHQVQKNGFIFTTDNKKMPSFCCWSRRTKSWCDLIDGWWSLSSRRAVAPKLPKAYIIIKEAHLLNTLRSMYTNKSSSFKGKIYSS